MGKIDWFCEKCSIAFRAHMGICVNCKKPIKAKNKNYG